MVTMESLSMRSSECGPFAGACHRGEHTIPRRRLAIGSALLVGVLLVITPRAAQAFCGFYVSGAGAEMFNNATQVVLMREGTRTVLSMQNNYQGPPENFAMVVPVPMVLSEDNVKTLDAEIFTRLDALAAPRLVEYWEEDPCAPQPEYEMMAMRGAVADEASASAPPEDGLGVTIEAEFTVGEYQVVILSATDSAGLDTWLRQEKYQIPQGAEPLLKPYVQAGSKFFVAKVDTAKVKFKDGMATLSPLRFHYDSDEFSLPVRLGMINSSGTQDLIVHILARGQRYEVANYKNVTIPTNLEVKNETRDRFAEFYAALFDRTLETNPKAVVTEYAWDASWCDPCPTPALNPGELATLGFDVLHVPMKPAADAKVAPPGPASNFVLTRLHARYQKGGLSDDLVFRAAPAIAGGREMGGRGGGQIEQGASPAGQNTFQGRYIIRHAWAGPIECENPRRGIWGGPPDGGKEKLKVASDVAFAPRGKLPLAAMVAQEVPEIGLSPTAAPAPGSSAGAGSGNPAPGEAVPPAKKSGKGCDAGAGAAGGAGAGNGLMLLMLLWLATRYYRRRHAMASAQTEGQVRS